MVSFAGVSIARERVIEMEWALDMTRIPITDAH
jgi:hypothetical protein